MAYTPNWNYNSPFGTNGSYYNSSAIPSPNGPTPSQQPQAQNGFNWVQGEAAAKAWPVPPNSTVLLMDTEDQKFYLKTVDASGMPLPLRIFTFKEITSEKKSEPDGTEYVTKREFEEFRHELLYGRPNTQKEKRGGNDREPTA